MTKENRKLPSRHFSQASVEPLNELMPPPPWLASLREAMVNSIRGDDLKAVMSAQVEKAKKGDLKAASFVMDQAHKLIEADKRQVSIVQNNYYDTPTEERPDTAATSEPGSDERLKKMRSRLNAGHPLVDPRDKPEGPKRMTDEEEKEIRRQMEAVERAEGTY